MVIHEGIIGAASSFANWDDFNLKQEISRR